MNSTPATKKETGSWRAGAKRLEQILREALPLVDVADTDEILDRDKRIEAILKQIEEIGRASRDKANSADRARSLSARRLERMRRALVHVEDHLVAFEPMGSARLGRKRSAVLKLALEVGEQRRERHSCSLMEVIGADRDGPILRKPGQVSPHLLEQLKQERQRRPMPAEAIEDLEFFTEVWRLAEKQAVERSNEISFYLELKELWHAIRGVGRSLDDALKTRSNTIGRPKDTAKVACASDILYALHPIRLGRRRELPFLRVALAPSGFSIPDDPTDFMRMVRARTKKLIEVFPPRPDGQPVLEVAPKAQAKAAWSHPEFFKRPQTTDRLLDALVKLERDTRKNQPRTR